MDLETKLLIIKIVPSVVALISTCLTIFACIKTGKWKGLFRKVGAVNIHTEKLVELIEEAEKHKNWTGIEKLSFVVINYHAYCIEQKLDYNEDETVKEIEELIDFSKQVNINKGNPKL